MSSQQCVAQTRGSSVGRTAAHQLSNAVLQAYSVPGLCPHAPLEFCAQVVESMRQGLSPLQAAEDAIRRIATRFPTYVGAVVAVDKTGRLGAACYGWTFKYTYRDAAAEAATIVTVEPLRLEEKQE